MASDRPPAQSGGAAPERYPGAVSPPPNSLSSFSWRDGVFQAARRPMTACVEGTLRSDAPILMATLRGGAERHEFSTDDGLSFDGPDRMGSISFLPAGCERRLRLHSVSWSWAAISLHSSSARSLLALVPSFCTTRDPLLHAAMAELAKLGEEDGGFDEAYLAAVAGMLSAYLARRYGTNPRAARPLPKLRLTAGQLRRVDEYVEGHLSRPVRVSDVAAVLYLSEGHFHRAYRATRNETPLSTINRRRIARAALLLRSTEMSVAAVALEVGFSNPSAFARTFRALAGESPQNYRSRENR